MTAMHEIEYKIYGDDMQFVEVELDPNEATVAEAGGMMYMDDGIEMETIFGDGSQKSGGFLGALVAFQPSVSYDIRYVGKIKPALFGGEGLFFATLRGPGRVWLQSLPLSRLANRIIAAAPGLAKGGKGEGSILGGIGGLLDGDNS